VPDALGFAFRGTAEGGCPYMVHLANETGFTLVKPVSLLRLFVFSDAPDR